MASTTLRCTEICALHYALTSLAGICQNHSKHRHFLFVVLRVNMIHKLYYELYCCHFLDWRGGFINKTRQIIIMNDLSFTEVQTCVHFIPKFTKIGKLSNYSSHSHRIIGCELYRGNPNDVRLYVDMFT